MKTIIFFLLLATSLFGINCGDFQGEFKTYNGHYYAITGNKMSFEVARKFAEANNGYLAIPNNAGENNFIKTIIGNNNEAWLGIYDPNYTKSYCYTANCFSTSRTRFKTVQGASLLYQNWDSKDVENQLMENDGTVDKFNKPIISLLGEHWVLMSGNTGLWRDWGNHFIEGQNPTLQKAIIEFDSKPICYENPTNITDEISGRVCNSQIWDTVLGVTDGTTMQCLEDINKIEYCPQSLSPCGQNWDYTDGYAVSGVGQVVDYTNKESSSGGGAEVIGTVEYQYRGNGSGIDMFFRTTGAGYNKTNYIKKSSSWILDENTQSGWAGDILGELSGMYSIYGCDSGGVLKYKSHNNNTMTVYMECVKENCDYPATKQNIRYGTYTFCGQEHALGVPKTFNINGNTVTITASKSSSYATINGNKQAIHAAGSSFSSDGITVTKISYGYNSGGCKYKNIISVDYEALTCPNGGTLSGTTCKKSCNNVTKCPAGYTETAGAETSKGECKTNQNYTYYKYICDNGYSPIDSGGDSGKSDTNNTIINDLSGDLNSSTPPALNCKKEKFTCLANEKRPCALVDNVMQCSPFPCIGNTDIENVGTIEGENDKNNDGWKNDGSCAGQLYIFNGEDKRCRSKDKLFGLTGGGCCDKDKVFMGLIGCKDKEKILAKKRKNDVCYYVGDYCSKKIPLLGCIQTSESYCCFNSKLARIIHEQGRPQLKMEWGSPESPNCKGFTPDEFQKLDFSKIDFTEFAKDIQQKTTNFKNIGNFVQNKVEQHFTK